LKPTSGFTVWLTGLFGAYEPPLTPEVIIRSDRETPAEGVEKIWKALEALGLLQSRFTKTAPVDIG
jgi:adenylylsulfate kinase-like enzyme